MDYKFLSVKLLLKSKTLNKLHVMYEYLEFRQRFYSKSAFNCLRDCRWPIIYRNEASFLIINSYLCVSGA
jgi:MinD superfamily P-loop ATPase